MRGIGKPFGVVRGEGEGERTMLLANLSRREKSAESRLVDVIR